MTLSLDEALVMRLSGDDFLRANLADYPKGSGKPAIFTAQSVPENTEYPYLWLPGEHSSVDDDTKNAQLETVHRDVFVVVRDVGADDLAQRMAWAVRRVLHKRPLALDVDQNVSLNAAPPIVAPAGDGVIARLVQLRLLLSEG